jgi:hypothetical protein
MHYRQKKVLGALQVIQVFLDQHDDVLGAINTGGGRSALNDIVTQFKALEIRQDPTRFERMSEVVAERTARDDLREHHMLPIAKIAKVALPHAAELEQLRMPHGTVDSHTHTMWARVMAKAAAVHQATFVSQGLEPDFITKLEAAVEPLEKAWKARVHARAVRVGVTSELGVQTKRALGVIGVLDALVAPKLATNALLFREWGVVKRVARRVVRTANEEVALPAPPAGPAVAAPETPSVAGTSDATTPTRPKESAE